MKRRASIAAFLFALSSTWPAAAADGPRRLLAVFAHPDDETLVGPLLAAQARKGVKVHLATVTDGEKGTQAHAGIPAGAALARVREEELRCAAAALGIEPPTMLGFKDGELGRIGGPPWAYLAEVEGAVASVIRRVRPDAIVTFGPEGAYGHPDHRLVGTVVTQLVQKGVEGAPERLFYPGFPKDRLPPAPAGTLPWSPTEPRFLTVRVPYEAADLEATIAALRCHKSQFRAEEMEPLARFMDRVLDGRVHLRPWFGALEGADLFPLAPPAR